MTIQEMKEFEARYGDQRNVIRVAKYPSQLLGIGIEYIVYEGRLIAKFFDGNLVQPVVRKSTKP